MAGDQTTAERPRGFPAWGLGAFTVGLVISALQWRESVAPDWAFYPLVALAILLAAGFALMFLDWALQHYTSLRLRSPVQSPIYRHKEPQPQSPSQVDATIRRLEGETVLVYRQAFTMADFFVRFAGEFARGFDDDYLVDVTNRAIALTTPEGSSFPFDDVKRALGWLEVEGLVKSISRVGPQYYDRRVYTNPIPTSFYTLEPFGSEVLKALKDKYYKPIPEFKIN